MGGGDRAEFIPLGVGVGFEQSKLCDAVGGTVGVARWIQSVCVQVCGNAGMKLITQEAIHKNWPEVLGGKLA
ncbi:hypothetical protein K1719_020245 [Acacia pycnantha]|nr:hypothetical protein K1719_020245 [Acacia pycnantha]